MHIFCYNGLQVQAVALLAPLNILDPVSQMKQISLID